MSCNRCPATLAAIVMLPAVAGPTRRLHPCRMRREGDRQQSSMVVLLPRVVDADSPVRSARRWPQRIFPRPSPRWGYRLFRRKLRFRAKALLGTGEEVAEESDNGDMSRGLGRIERAILARIASSKRMAINRTKKYRKVVETAIAAGRVQRSDINLKDDESPVHITARTLAYECFGPRPQKWGWTPSRSQIKVCTRAIQSIARKFPQYGIILGRGRKGTVLTIPSIMSSLPPEILELVDREARTKGARLMSKTLVLAASAAVALGSIVTTSNADAPNRQIAPGEWKAMKKIACAAALALTCAAVSGFAADVPTKTQPTLVSPPVSALVSPWDVAFGAALMSDYNFRGITQSNHKPSVAAYFEPRYNFNDSLQGYVGVAGESISFPNRAAAEIDFYTGIRPTFGKLALDFGFWEYWYPGGQCFNNLDFTGADCAVQGPLPNGNVIKADLSFWEIYAKGTYTVNDQFSFGGSVYWSPSVLNSGADGTFVAGTAKYILPTVLPNGIGWFISGDVGHWFLGTSDSFYAVSGFPGGIPYKSYTTWDVGVAFTWKQFTLDLRYFDTNLNKGDCNAFTSDHTASGVSSTAINPGGPGSNWCSAAFIAKLSVDLTKDNLK